MRVLITGATGLLGRALISQNEGKHKLICCVHKTKLENKLHKVRVAELDITNKENVDELMQKFLPEVLIHTASIGNVDYCEKYQSEAHQVNVVGTENLLNAAKKGDCHFVFLSSNAVFDGLSAPYDEHSKLAPVNYYGQTKTEAENLVQASKLPYTIIRPVLMFGWNHPKERKNPATWVIDELSRGRQLNLVGDVYNNPIYNIDAADFIWAIINRKLYGVYHIAGANRVSRYEFGKQVAEIFDLGFSLIHEVDSSYFPEIARRMPDTTFLTTKIQTQTKIKPKSLINALLRMKKNKKMLEQ